MMKTIHAFFLKLIGSLFAFVLLAAPSLGVANVLITQVDVLVGGARYCSNFVGCTNDIWPTISVGTPINLLTGQTLILTQTGDNIGSQPHGGENFDTSDRGGAAALLACSNAGGTPCTVQVFINGVLVFTDNGNSDNLAARNLEPTSDPGAAANVAFQEDRVWSGNLSSNPAFDLQVGYADDIHGGGCTSLGPGGCFPQALWGPGTGAANFFIGAGIGPLGNCLPSNTFPGSTHPQAIDGCYDAGALLITGRAVAVPEPSSLLLLGVALAGLSGLRRRRSA